MSSSGTVVIVGGTSAIGRRIAAHYAGQGHPVVVTSRSGERARALAQELGPACQGLALDLCNPHQVAAALAGVADVEHLVLLAIDRDENTVRDYRIDGALNLVTLKLVGYMEVVHALALQMRQRASIVLYGGLAKDRPYPGSTMVTAVNGAIMAMVRTLAVELAPVRVNALHPAVIGDSPYWAGKPAAVLEALRARTPLGRLVTIEDVVQATVFLLGSPAITGLNLDVDGGWLLK